MYVIYMHKQDLHEFKYYQIIPHIAQNLLYRLQIYL